MIRGWRWNNNFSWIARENLFSLDHKTADNRIKIKLEKLKDPFKNVEVSLLNLIFRWPRHLKLLKI